MRWPDRSARERSPDLERRPSPARQLRRLRRRDGSRLVPDRAAWSGQTQRSWPASPSRPAERRDVSWWSSCLLLLPSLVGIGPPAAVATPPPPVRAHRRLQVRLEEELCQQHEAPRLPEADRLDREDIDERHAPEPYEKAADPDEEPGAHDDECRKEPDQIAHEASATFLAVGGVIDVHSLPPLQELDAVLGVGLRDEVDEQSEIAKPESEEHGSSDLFHRHSVARPLENRGALLEHSKVEVVRHIGQPVAS